MRKLFGLFFICLAVYLLLNTILDNPKHQPQGEQKVVNEWKDETEERKYKIVIDPGHGGEDPGATGFSGSVEKDFTLSLAKKVSNLLEKDKQFEVFLTRHEDIFLSAVSRERPNYANNIEADLFISLHANTFEDPIVSGTETYYYDEKSKSLAMVMHQYVVEVTGFNDRNVRKEDFFVLKDTLMPAALLEIGYITNSEEEQKMLQDDFQMRVAEAIYKGIQDYLK